VKLFGAGWHDAVGIQVVRKYLERVRLLRDYKSIDQDPVYSAVRAVHQLLCWFCWKSHFFTWLLCTRDYCMHMQL